MTDKALNPSPDKLLPAYLQSTGLRVHPSCHRREGGAGPAEGITLIVNERPISVPTTGLTTGDSPYTLHQIDGKHFILNNGAPIKQVTLPPSPRFYTLKTGQGVAYREIALLHGSSCLASTVLQECTYWNSPDRCTFCGIEISLQSRFTVARKTPQDLAEVAKAALRLDAISHITLTTGTQEDSSFESEYLAACSAAIKAETDLPIHVQCMPPPDLNSLEFLKQSGVDTIGIHIESFDHSILEHSAPCKARIDIKHYITVWKECVRLFGTNQVSSFLIVGLGERNSSTIEGAALLCELGIYPFIVPLRPIPGTHLEGHTPPDIGQIIPLYREVASLLKASDLSWKKSKAGCVRCGACSALPDFEHS